MSPRAQWQSRLCTVRGCFPELVNAEGRVAQQETVVAELGREREWGSDVCRAARIIITRLFWSILKLQLFNLLFIYCDYLLT